METSVRFTPLTGVDAESPLCYLLEIDSFTILLDCGWDENFDEAALEPVKRVLPRVNAVLLSHPDLLHLGALPYLVGKCGLEAPIFSTKPVRRMGEMFLFETYIAKQAISDFDTFDLDDIDAAFRLNPRWTELRFSQHHVLVPPSPGAVAEQDGGDGGTAPAVAPVQGGGISITAHAAGRFPGGAVWRISLGCGEELVYAVDYNHRKEKLLNRTTFDELLISQQPALLISDAFSALTDKPDRRRRDQEFLDTINATVEAEGNVLIPTDAAGRVLELALLLDEHFSKSRVSAVAVILSATIKTVLEFARTQLEYLGNELVQAFSLKRSVPFSFRKLSVITRMEELGSFPGPKVVLATMPSLESGPARALLVEWAGLPKNTIIFTERAQTGTLAAVLQDYDPSASPSAEPLRVPLRVARRVPLEGEELAAWMGAKLAEAEAVQEAARSASGGLSSFPSLSSAASLTPASRLAAAARLASSGSVPTVGGGGVGGGGGGGRGPSTVLSSPGASAPGHGGGMLSDQPLRANTGSISRLVRDSTTGAIVQTLVGQTPGGAIRAGGGGTMGQRAGGGGAGWDAELLIDGFEPPQDVTYPMFPDEDEPLYCEWDEYGAVLRKDEFRVAILADAGGGGSVAGRAVGGDGMDVDGGGDGTGGGGGGGGGGTSTAQGGDANDVADEVDEAPTKLVATEVDLEVRAAIRFFDFEGRSEGRAAVEYLARVAPRRLALVHGSTAARAALAGVLRRELTYHGTQVFTPELGEVVGAQLAPSQLATLGPALAKSLAIRQAGQYGVAWLEGVITAAAGPLAPGAPLPILEPLLEEEHGGAAAGTTATRPGGSGSGGCSAGAGSVLLAQAGSVLTLTRLKAALSAAGFQSHFPSRGVLAVMVADGPSAASLLVTLGTGTGAGGVAVSTSSPTAPSSADRVVHVALEGPATEDYFRVREVIYDQFGVC